MQEKMRPLTKYSIEYIKLLFLNSIQRTKANMTTVLLIAKYKESLFIIHRKYQLKAQSKFFHDWYSFNMLEKNNEMLNQTTVQFKDVEDNMQHLENNIRKYQSELEDYEEKVKTANEELVNQKEENKKLKQVT